MLKVSARAPTRIDLAGGTLDLWPIHHLLDKKATVNVGITLDAQVELTGSRDARFRLHSQDQDLRFEGSFEEACATKDLPLIGLLLKALWRADLPALTIVTAAKSPAGAGLGGSSCLGITVAGALRKAREQLDPKLRALDEHELVRTVQDVEARLIHSPTGVQDYWGAVRGGVNVIRFPFGRTEVTTFPPEALLGLADELVVCYSGRSRQSAINNWEIFKRLFDGDRDLLAIFNRIGATAEQCGTAVEDGDLARALHLSQLEWDMRLRLWPAIETAETKRLDHAAKGAGARFSRVCGAGGGGVMAIFTPPDRRLKVEGALREAGGVILDASASPHGLSVV